MCVRKAHAGLFLLFISENESERRIIKWEEEKKILDRQSGIRYTDISNYYCLNKGGAYDKTQQTAGCNFRLLT